MGGGAYVSKNGGESFVQRNDGFIAGEGDLSSGTSEPIPHPYLYFGCCVDDIAVNQVDPNYVYVALHDPGIVYTDNGGEDWRYLNNGFMPLLSHAYSYRGPMRDRPTAG